MTFRDMAGRPGTRGNQGGRSGSQHPETNPSVGDDNAQWPQFMQQMQQQQNQFMLQMMQQMNGGTHPQVVVPEAVGGNFRDFFHMNPP